ncbi:hypothetical protein KFL_000780010 [Klebsormidium nitens]|uniref:Uncharacterized protein n=1 Tax=Klebsormidium nitens TaxID=105231 RepID=A0A1Y1HZQ3_KLENI|nr:hypothetical protein KFL_000780010 [Klebsormidium nitens]|eukprot:GAQ81338.1 hypothetical protein KFL_000780010 [Klebsormidium nitens]
MACNNVHLLCLVALHLTLVSKVGTFTIEEVQGAVRGTVLDLRGGAFRYRLRGSIPPALGSLSNLTYLDLSNNVLDGMVPPELGQLSKLRYLNLSSNYFSGVIPRELGGLSSLAYLDLSNNKRTSIIGLFNGFSGGIPGDLFKLTGLVQLYLSNNDLTGGIPSEF